jgi:hypothetical protein
MMLSRNVDRASLQQSLFKVLKSKDDFNKNSMQTLISYFTELTDPRIDMSRTHLMEDIIFITIASVICGAETWNDIENYGKSKESWLKQYLQLPHGIPSHDTFNRFFSALDPDEFEQAFLSWIKDISELTEATW